jgi:imidazolonepropionase-like amidohydrolase
MPITTTAGHCHWLGQRADNEQEVVLATRRMVEAGADFIKVMSTGGGMTPTSNIYEPQYTVAELSAIVREASRLRRRVTAHSHSPSGQRACLEAGIGMIEHCNWHTPQGQCFDEELTARLNAAGVYFGITLSGPQQRAAMVDQPFAALSPDLQRRYEILRRMREMGSKIVLHSDAIAPITTYEAFPFSLIAAIRYGGFSLPEAIHAASGRAAEAIGLGDEVGTLAPGKAADVLIVSGDIERDLRALNCTRQVLRGGRILAEHGAVRVTASTVPASDGGR